MEQSLCRDLPLPGFGKPHPSTYSPSSTLKISHAIRSQEHPSPPVKYVGQCSYFVTNAITVSRGVPIAKNAPHFWLAGKIHLAAQLQNKWRFSYALLFPSPSFVPFATPSEAPTGVMSQLLIMISGLFKGLSPHRRQRPTLRIAAN